MASRWAPAPHARCWIVTPRRPSEPLDYMLSLTDTAMEEMRALILELRPESLEREGLTSALRKLAEATQHRDQLIVQAHVCSEPAIRWRRSRRSIASRRRRYITSSSTPMPPCST